MFGKLKRLKRMNKELEEKLGETKKKSESAESLSETYLAEIKKLEEIIAGMKHPVQEECKRGNWCEACVFAIPVRSLYGTTVHICGYGR